MAVNESADCREDAACELINSAKILQSNRLDLSRRRILQLPPSLLELTKLEFLYLEGNLLTELPETLFEQLISLKWLDLRNNKLINLPLNVRKQRCLRSLLLDGNNLKSLPVELGFVHSLTGLHLAGNPLDFPPKHVVDKGTQEILKFLRDQVPGDEAEITQELDDEKQGPIKEVKRHGEESSLPSSSSSDEDDTFPQLPPVKTYIPKVLSEATVKGSYRVRKLSPSNNGEFELHNGRVNLNPRPALSLPMFTRERLSMKDKVREKKVLKTSQAPREDCFSKDEIEPKPRESKSSKGENSIPSPRRRQKNVNAIKTKNVAKRVAKIAIPDEVRFDRETSYDMLETVKQMEREEDLQGLEIQSLLGVKTANEQSDRALKFDPSTLKKGDMVALRVPSKHFIPGQPCLGKVVDLPDKAGLLLVHYYTGNYEGIWRPMMSRSSPYLRKVPIGVVVCTFELSENGRMTQETIAEVKSLCTT